MKVGTLTYPGSPSHGASLQMYALYKVLEKRSTEVEVINYIPDTVIHKRPIRMKTGKRFANALASLFLKSNKSAFKKFEKQLRMNPPSPIKTTQEIKECTLKYDRIIVGSDQVWNPVVTDNDMNFYLEFCDDASKKASYAPSFGVDHVAEADKEKISKLLGEITYLSAREERGREIIEELTGRSVPVVLDPTFLLEGNEWRKAKKPSGAKGKYVFVFTIKPSARLKKAAQAYADAHGFKLVYISGGFHGLLDKLNPQKNPVFGIGPAEFVDLIDNAECIFTNSFHGTAFSIILNKKFFVEFSSDTNSRLDNIVKTFELQDCIIDCDKFSCKPVDVDYEKVNGILSTKREESIKYLKAIID